MRLSCHARAQAIIVLAFSMGRLQTAQGAAVATPTPDVIELSGQASINWSHHIWRVRGHSLPVSPALSFGGPVRQAGGALTLARADALVRLEKLSESMFWGQLPAAQPSANAPQTHAAPRPWGQARTVATQFFSDGHVTLTQDFNWDQALAEPLWRARQTIIQADSAAPRPQPAPPGSQDGLAGMPTGLVVNARGLQVRPAILPELQDAAGAALYSIRDVHPEALSRFGVARYSHSLDAAVKDERMGAHPVVVRAHATADKAPWVIIFDARQTAAVQAASAALAQSKIIIVIDDEQFTQMP
jgi:hypothetical protein